MAAMPGPAITAENDTSPLSHSQARQMGRWLLDNGWQHAEVVEDLKYGAVSVRGLTRAGAKRSISSRSGFQEEKQWIG